MLDVVAYRGRHAVGPAAGGPGKRQCAQMAGGSRAGRHDFLGIFVAQLVEIEAAALGDGERLREQRRRIQLTQSCQRTQGSLPVRIQGIACLRHRYTQTYCSQHILQGTAAATMHVHIAGRNARQLQCFTQLLEAEQTARIVAAGQQFHTDPEACGEALAQPQSVLVLGVCQRTARTWQPDDQAARQGIFEIGARQLIAALGTGTAGLADQTAQSAVARPIRGERHELESLEAVEFGADDQRQTDFLGGRVGAHDPGHRAFIGQRQRAVPQALGLIDQFLGVRSAA